MVLQLVCNRTGIYPASCGSRSVLLITSSVQSSRTVVSDSLRPHELQHATPPRSSPTPRVHPNSCASSWWCHPAISYFSSLSLDSILKSRDITLPTKVCLVKAVVFPVVMYGCESWTIKKAERQRIAAFELCCWRRLLRVPFGKTHAEAKTPILWPLYVKNWLIGKYPDTWKDWRLEERGNDRGWDGWIASLTRWTWVWVSSRRGWWTGNPGVHRVSKESDMTEQLNWTELNWCNRAGI